MKFFRWVDGDDTALREQTSGFELEVLARDTPANTDAGNLFQDATAMRGGALSGVPNATSVVSREPRTGSKPTPPNQDWFEMADLRRHRFASAVWVPLRAAHRKDLGDNAEEFLGLGSVAFPPNSRVEAEKLGWSDIGLSRDAWPHAYRDRNHKYKTVETFQWHDGVDMGINLVFARWLVNPDLVLALRLEQEGDSWVRPDEGYIEVMRQSRNDDGSVNLIEIKSEFLRDYLAARGLALRLAYYRQRKAILADTTHISWPSSGIHISKPHDRFETVIFKVDEQGMPHTGSAAIFRVWRTDDVVDDDVPVLGPESPDNTDGTSHYAEAQEEPNFFNVEGELWREEWIEPATRSERVRGDDSDEVFSYFVDASGGRETAKMLDNQDIGRWLWFDARIFTTLSGRRGAGFEWYTRNTGGIWLGRSWGKLLFGLNELGLVNLYAYDIAKLDTWEQRIWSGYNVAPVGGVSKELFDAQVRTSPANTFAPEQLMRHALGEVDRAFVELAKAPLFRPHGHQSQILDNVHRFRALESGGLLALAKDLARLTADSINQETLRKVISDRDGDKKLGSLKHLEKVLATRATEENAHRVMSSLFGIYELRLGDAHLPTSKIQEAFKLAEVDTSLIPLQQGAALILAAGRSLMRVAAIVRAMRQA